jgi:hypothetical protein
MTVTPLRPPCPTHAALLELWRPVAGHDGYEVSWDGRVRNARTGRVLKPQQAKGGHYRKVCLGRAVQVQVHQLVADAWLDRPKTGMPLVVDHVDNEGTRNVATNLRWLTYSMNTRCWYAMNARYEAAGVAHGWDLRPEADADAEAEWSATFTRLQAAGL